MEEEKICILLFIISLDTMYMLVGGLLMFQRVKLCSLLYTTTGARAHTGAYFGEGSGPIHLDFVQCSGSEYNLTECEIRRDKIRIDHSFDVGVKCQPGRARVVFCVSGSMTTHTFKKVFTQVPII